MDGYVDSVKTSQTEEDIMEYKTEIEAGEVTEVRIQLIQKIESVASYNIHLSRVFFTTPLDGE